MKDAKIENRILKELISDIASHACDSVEGVSKVSEIKSDSINDTDELIIDAYIKIKYGFRIPQVAWDVQTAISGAVSSVTDRSVKTVNIHIEGVNPA